MSTREGFAKFKIILERIVGRMCFSLIQIHTSCSLLDISCPLSFDKSSFLRSSSMYCLRYLPFWYWVLPVQFFLFITSFVLNVLFVLCFICTLHILSYFPYLSSSYFVYVGPEKVMRTKMKEWENTCACVCSPACVRLPACVSARACGRASRKNNGPFWIPDSSVSLRSGQLDILFLLRKQGIRIT